HPSPTSGRSFQISSAAPDVSVRPRGGNRTPRKPSAGVGGEVRRRHLLNSVTRQNARDHAVMRDDEIDIGNPKPD
ncbi:hypothetical protein, partial [Streptococcus pneumoniae]|uniref:hypothetical protein n=1 Tax=Streptococcus pneumoniae TaxID=1313 RepID=UPI001E5FDBDB